MRLFEQNENYIFLDIQKELEMNFKIRYIWGKSEEGPVSYRILKIAHKSEISAELNSKLSVSIYLWFWPKISTFIFIICQFLAQELDFCLIFCYFFLFLCFGNEASRTRCVCLSVGLSVCLQNKKKRPRAALYDAATLYLTVSLAF